MAQEECRQLDQTEKKIVLKRVDDIQKDRAYVQYLIHDAELKINEGLYQNFVFQRRRYEQERKECISKINELDKTLLLLHEQLTKGVLKKEPEKEKMEGIENG